MKKFYLITGVVFTAVAGYFSAVWFVLASKDKGTKTDLQALFNAQIPDFIKNHIDVAYLCLFLSVVSVGCFLKYTQNSFGVFQKMGGVLLIVSILLSCWYVWILM